MKSLAILGSMLSKSARMNRSGLASAVSSGQNFSTKTAPGTTD
jgi:hypothetical protein